MDETLELDVGPWGVLVEVGVDSAHFFLSVDGYHVGAFVILSTALPLLIACQHQSTDPQRTT